MTSIRERITEQQFETWFKGVELEACSHEEIRLRVPNTFAREWLRKNYSGLILEAIEEAQGARPELRLVVREGAESSLAAQGSLSAAVKKAVGKIEAPRPEPPAPAPAEALHAIHLNARYRLDRFVVGQGNRVPHAAVQALVERRGPAPFNPLFLHGGVGLGKTHLIQGLCVALREQDPAARILYVPCEHFINEFIAAVERSDLEGFRRRYRRVDALLMDDVHILGHKERTQEEFFNTFNSLHDAGKIIVLGADAAPPALGGLSDRLTSRFNWGMVCELERPSLETRLRIVRQQAANLEGELPDEVSEYVAEHIRTNVRELEGAVTRVVGFASLTGAAIDLELAREALRDVASHRRRRVTLDHISTAVTGHYGVRLAELQSKRRTQAIAVPRQICMYLARRLTGHSLEEIGGYFGGRDHSTVLYANEKIGRRSGTDAAFRALVDQLGIRACDEASVTQD